jgi:hypothetical protein
MTGEGSPLLCFCLSSIVITVVFFYLSDIGTEFSLVKTLFFTHHDAFQIVTKSHFIHLVDPIQDRRKFRKNSLDSL